MTTPGQEPPGPSIPADPAFPASGAQPAGRGLSADVRTLVGRPRVSLLDLACIGPLVISSVLSLVTLPLIPALIGTRPVLLEAVTGSTTAMVAAGAFARVGRTSMLVAFLAPLSGLMAFDPFTWWAGRRYGTRILAFYARQGGRQQRQVERGTRLFAQWGGWAIVLAYYLLPIPNPVIYFAAGADGMPLWRFLVLDLIGTLLWSTVVVALGVALGQHAIDVVDTISHDALFASLALCVVVIAVTVWRGRVRG